MKSLVENLAALLAKNYVTVGISADSIPYKKAWAMDLKMKKTPLLCDFWPQGAVAKEFGLFQDQNGFFERTNVIVNEKQKIVFVKVYPIHSVPDIQEILNFL